jgi:hypothetical protein
MTELANNENLCPACLSNGKLRYPEKLEDNLFNDLTFASRKRPELMHYDLFECENCKTLFTNRNVDLSQLLKNYEIAVPRGWKNKLTVDLINDNGVYIGNSHFVTKNDMKFLARVVEDIHDRFWHNN